MMPVTIHKITAKELVQLGMSPRRPLHNLGAKPHCRMVLAVAFRQIKSVKGQPHASKNGRNPELSNVLNIFC